MKSDEVEDSVLRRLTREDRARLGMDAWEPSLLRRLMKGREESRCDGQAEPSSEENCV